MDAVNKEGDRRNSSTESGVKSRFRGWGGTLENTHEIWRREKTGTEREY